MLLIFTNNGGWSMSGRSGEMKLPTPRPKSQFNFGCDGI